MGLGLNELVHGLCAYDENLRYLPDVDSDRRRGIKN